MNPLRRVFVVFSASIALALFVSAPAQAAWGVSYHANIQVTGNGQNLGATSGWVQFDTNGDTFRYSIQICRQSSYVPPTLTVSVNRSSYDLDGTFVTSHQPGWGGSCETVTGQHTWNNHRNVYFVLTGSTFVNGNNHTYFDQDRQVNNPY